MKFLIIAICILSPVAWAFRNGYQRQESGINHNANRKWHLWEFIIKCCLAAVVVILTEGWWFKGWGLVMVASLDFLFFPYLLNLRTNQHWAYLSPNGIDKFLRKIPVYVLFVVKILLAFVSSVYYVVKPFN